jgi:hypothetical protein
MKQFNFKQLLPHGIAIAIFLLVTVIFCKPALEKDVVMQQSDVTAVESMKHQSDVYREKHGDYPLWVTSMFCGMPAYNIIFNGPTSPFANVNNLFQLWLPKPLNFFFLSCICFYIFCLCIKVRPYVGIFASLAFAYATYNPILVVAGHDTKLLALAYAPALLGSILLLFDKKYVAGFVLTALFANLHLMQNHQQISYYLIIIIVVMTIFFLAQWIKQKELLHGVKAISLALAGAIIAVCINAIILLPVLDYAKYSKRGGQLVMDNKKENGGTKVEKNKTTGLSRDYAFQWSNDQIESLTLLFPGIAGYGRQVAERDGEYSIYPELTEKSAVANFLIEKQNFPEEKAAEFAKGMYADIYWGGKPFTTGPAYVGAVICTLFLLGMFFLNSKHKWWILTASIIGIVMACGKNLPGINNFLFDYLPIYNKFRTPEMALVIPQLLFPIIAVLTVDLLLDGTNKELKKQFKFGAIAVGAIFALATTLYFTLDYTKANKERTNAINVLFAAPADSTLSTKYQAINEKFQPERDNQFYEKLLQQTNGNTEIAKGLLTALKKDRQSFFGGDIARALIFALLTLALVGFVVYGKGNKLVLLISLPILVLADLLPIGLHYINDKNFDTKEKYQANQFSPSAADTEILKDKDPNYRVFDMSGGDPFQDSKPSYFHKSIGGYHPAKIGIYDDLATYQLSGNLNPSVLNMLNAKYIIQKSQDGKNTVAIPNSGALGNCWFVKRVKYVDGPVNEMKALDNFNPIDTAVVDNSYKAIIGNFSAADSAASIKQTAFDNMAITYQSNSSSNNLAVFSEIFYKDWVATIDGKEVPIAKANYVLRALNIPAGKHTIEFKYINKVYNLSYTISLCSMWLLIGLLLWFGYFSFKNANKN